MQYGYMLYMARLLLCLQFGTTKLANTMAALQQARQKWHAQMMTIRLRDNTRQMNTSIPDETTAKLLGGYLPLPVFPIS
jgi:hypothetical protein